MSKKVKMSELPEFDMAEHLADERAIADYLTIVLEENVWLGGGVIVLPGVTIGRDSVIGAGAVVTRDVPPRSVAVGNPATVVRTL